MPVFAYEFVPGDTQPSRIELVGQGNLAAINRAKQLLMNQVIIEACSLPAGEYEDSPGSFGESAEAKIKNLEGAHRKLQAIAEADPFDLPVDVVHPVLATAIARSDDRFQAVDKLSSESLNFDDPRGAINIGIEKLKTSDFMNDTPEEMSSLAREIRNNCDYWVFTPQPGDYDQQVFDQHETFGYEDGNGNLTPLLTVLSSDYYTRSR